MMVPSFRHLLTAALFPLLLLGAVDVFARKAPLVRLSVDVRYYYGRWQWGEFKMTPRAGMAGPDLRLELQEGRWALRAAYLSGDFAAVGATPLQDAVYGSRKNFRSTDNREEFAVGLEFHPRPWIGGALVYTLVQYDLVVDVELNSDQRLYGRGREQVVDEAWGWGAGLLPRLPLGRGLAVHGEIFYFPRLTARGAGTYQYEMLYNRDRLDERWFGRTSVHGFRGQMELIYALARVPVSLSLGYFHQFLDAREAAAEGWLEVYLAGQTQARTWREDRFHGVTARAGFSF